MKQINRILGRMEASLNGSLDGFELDNTNDVIEKSLVIDMVNDLKMLVNEASTEIKNISSKPVLADNAFRDAFSTLLRLGSNMLTTGISEEISEWDLPKTTPLKTKRKIVHEAKKWNTVNKMRAIELKGVYNILSPYFNSLNSLTNSL